MVDLWTFLRQLGQRWEVLGVDSRLLLTGVLSSRLGLATTSWAVVVELSWLGGGVGEVDIEVQVLLALQLLALNVLDLSWLGVDLLLLDQQLGVLQLVDALLWGWGLVEGVVVDLVQVVLQGLLVSSWSLLRGLVGLNLGLGVQLSSSLVGQLLLVVTPALSDFLLSVNLTGSRLTVGCSSGGVGGSLGAGGLGWSVSGSVVLSAVVSVSQGTLVAGWLRSVLGFRWVGGWRRNIGLLRRSVLLHELLWRKRSDNIGVLDVVS